MEGTEILELPWPPSANLYWRIFHNRMVVSAQARKYRQSVCFIAFRLRRAFWNKRISLDIQAFPPDNRKTDLDNRLKILIDALQDSKIFEDDSQIDRILIQRKEVQKPGKVIVSISEIN